MMSESDGIATVVADGNTFEVESSSSTPAQVKANLASEETEKPSTTEIEPTEEERVSKAASELGKKGGKAAAEARKAAGEPAKPEVEAKPAEAPEKAPEVAEDAEEGKPSRAQARIQQLARERNEERQARRELESRLARLEAQQAPPAEPKAEPARKPNGKPAPDQFETYEEYVEALTDHKMEERIQRLTEQAEEQRAVKARVDEISGKLDGFRKRITPDVLERVDPRLLDLKPSFEVAPGEPLGPANALADELIESEVGPQMMLYLTQNEADVISLFKSPNRLAFAKAFARLEAKVGGQAVPEPTSAPKETYSQAKPPVRPVTPSAAGEEDVDGIEDFDEYMKRANARDARLRRAR